MELNRTDTVGLIVGSQSLALTLHCFFLQIQAFLTSQYTVSHYLCLQGIFKKAQKCIFLSSGEINRGDTESCKYDKSEMRENSF